MRRTIVTLLSALALLATGVVAGFAVGGSGTVDPPPKIAFLANGINPADAVAGGAIAGQLGAPIFTTNPGVLEDAAKNGIVTYAPELVIVLGGPVAVSDAVLQSLAAATGLSIVPASTTNPQAGITRVAGETRYDTAAAVAKLVAAYAPAYLPVDATALGAVDADTLDGKDSTDFAASGQACDAGDVVTAVDDDGTLLCTTDEVGAAGNFVSADQACSAGDVVTGANADGDVLCDADQIDGGDADTVDGIDGIDLAFPTTLPTGRTVRGFYGINSHPSAGSDFVGTAIDYGVLLPSSPDRIFVPSGASDATCTGTANVPTAPEGVLCVYEAFGSANVGFFTFGSVANSHRFGTLITFDTASAGRVTAYGTWAVTGGATVRSSSTSDMEAAEREAAAR